MLIAQLRCKRTNEKKNEMKTFRSDFAGPCRASQRRRLQRRRRRRRSVANSSPNASFGGLAALHIYTSIITSSSTSDYRNRNSAIQAEVHLLRSRWGTQCHCAASCCITTLSYDSVVVFSNATSISVDRCFPLLFLYSSFDLCNGVHTCAPARVVVAQEMVQ